MRCASWVRDLTPSLLNTLRRWYSTVFGLMNSCSAISGLVAPCATSCEICASWGVRSVQRLHRAFTGVLTGRSQLHAGPLAEPVHAQLGEQPVGGPQLVAGVPGSALAS